KRPKTTIHHHTRKLEEKRVLVAREQKRKNWIEKYYQINEELAFSDLKLNMSKAVKEGIPIENLQYTFNALGAIVYSMIERFNAYTIEHFEEWSTKEVNSKPKASFGLNLVGKEECEKYLEKLEEIHKIGETDEKSDKPACEDLWAIVTMVIPYGKIFEEVLKKKTHGTLREE
ncbi:MAG: hypothetical protein ACFFBD_29610, partial [Candidatus Hodarchaeota archaeon]